MTASTRALYLGASLMGLLLSLPLAAAPRLVEDLRTGLVDETSVMRSRGVHNGVFYFSQSDPAHGRELWRTDGTAEGTYRVTDVCPGPCDANPEHLEVIGGDLYFRATDGVSGYELWRSDGTPGSDLQVRDVCAGPCSSWPVPRAQGGRLLFTATAGKSSGVWQSDGTPEGTVRVREICQSCTVSVLDRLGDLFLFSASEPGGRGIWKTDGTAVGTVRIRKVAAEGLWDTASGFVAAGGFAFFWSPDALWRTDGTPAGTVLLKSKAALACRGCWIDESVVWKGSLYSLMNGSLVRSDGTRAGTRVLASFDDSESVRDLTPLGEWLVFLGGAEGFLASIWRTQGTPETTEKLFTPPQAVYLETMIPWGKDRALVPVQPRESDARMVLWETDGTLQGTRLLDVPVTSVSPFQMLPAGDRIYIRSFERSAILRLDDPADGLVPVYDLRTEASAGPLDQAVLGDKLLFSAQTSDERAPLFVSDGTAAGTRPISERAEWAAGFTRWGNRLLFTGGDASPGAPDPVRRHGLWTTDGTPGGTRLVSPRVSWFESPSILGGQLLFAAEWPQGGSSSWSGGADLELWRSDGTRAGTRAVKNINPFSTGYIEENFAFCDGSPSRPGPGVQVGGRLLFAADDGRSGRELWSSDGTPGGTRLLLDINPRTLPAPWAPEECGSPPRKTMGRGSDPEHLTAFRGGALFVAFDPAAGRELWWSDGTAAGTRRLADLRPGVDGSQIHDLTPLGGIVYFFASAGGAGEGLWRTDGTAKGTFLVHDLTVAGRPSWGSRLTVVGNRLFFSVLNETTGAELWTSRGFRASTALVADLRPGPQGSYPQALTDAGGVLVFAADDGVTGLEPWRSDGSVAGTRLLGDIHPGRGHSAPGPFSRVGDLVLTGADDGEHGRELWAIPLED